MNNRTLLGKGSIALYKPDPRGIRFEFKGEVRELANDPSRSMVPGQMNVEY